MAKAATRRQPPPPPPPPNQVSTQDYIDDINPVKPGNKGIIAKELIRIKKTHGQLTSEIVVQEATNNKNPLHSMFPWNDAHAGHRYRLMIAARMIQAAQYIWQRKQNKVPQGAVIKFPAYPSIGHGLRADRVTALNDPDSRQHIITAKLKSLRGTVLSLLDMDELDRLRVAVLNEVTKTASQLGITL
jgi:hypothetical protein